MGAQQAIDRVYTLILRGPIGAWWNKANVARELGISENAARAALRALEAMGRLECNHDFWALEPHDNGQNWRLIIGWRDKGGR